MIETIYPPGNPLFSHGNKTKLVGVVTRQAPCVDLQEGVTFVTCRRKGYKGMIDVPALFSKLLALRNKVFEDGANWLSYSVLLGETGMHSFGRVNTTSRLIVWQHYVQR